MAMNLGSFAGRVIATRVVATDGSGDFTDIQDAIDDLPASGGAIWIKEGTYTLTNLLTISSNTTLIGGGNATIIKTAVALQVGISLASKSNILIKDLQLYLLAAANTTGVINIDDLNNVTFYNVLFKIGNGNMETIFDPVSFNPATKLKILYCVLNESVDSLSEGVFNFAYRKTQIIGNRFDTAALFSTTGDIDMQNCIITNNFFASLFTDATTLNNVIIGNQTDVAIVDNGAGNEIAHNGLF